MEIKNTKAVMGLVYPDGKRYRLVYEFAGPVSEGGATFCFFEGNFSCDCNKSLFLSKQFDGIEELDCGDTIKIENFKVLGAICTSKTSN